MGKQPKLTEEQKQTFRERLEAMRREIMQGIQARISEKRASATGVKDIGDLYDNATEGRDQELGYLMNNRDRKKILLIQDALRRLEEGTYGICAECEEPINPKRLEAMPFTQLCVRCQEQEEQEERFARERELEEDERQYIELAEAGFAFDDELEE